MTQLYSDLPRLSNKVDMSRLNFGIRLTHTLARAERDLRNTAVTRLA